MDEAGLGKVILWLAWEKLNRDTQTAHGGVWGRDNGGGVSETVMLWYHTRTRVAESISPNVMENIEIQVLFTHLIKVK